MRGVIFDLGGTLVRNHPEPEPERERRQCAAIARLAAAECGCGDPEGLGERLWRLRDECGDMVLRDLVERPARGVIAAALREAGAAADEAFLERAERLLFDPDRGRPLYPGARELLDALRSRGLRIGLISNWSSHWIVTDIVAAAGLHDYFAPLISSAAFGRIKPHPSIFRHVLKTWGIGADQTVMVGDTLGTDILGASRAGMRSILVEIEASPSNAAAEAPVRPTYRVRDLLDIPALLERERGAV